MKKILLAVLITAGAMCAAQSASARGVIIYSTGEKLDVVQKFPQEVVDNDGEHFNLGVYFNQFSIFWVPMWNYGESKFVFVNDAGDAYFDVDESDFKWLKEEHGIDVPAKPVPGFWNRIGGKIIWIAVIAFALWGWWTTRKDDDDEVPSAPASEKPEE